MSKLQFSAADTAAANEVISASFGAAGIMAICKTYARGGIMALKTFEAAVAAAICERFGLKPGTSLSTIQALKRDARFLCDANPSGKNPATTVYTYCLKLRAVAGNLEAIEAVTARDATGQVKTEKAEKRAPKAEGTTPSPLTVDDAIAFLQAAHKAAALSPLHYAAIQALIPAPAPVRHMGEAVEVQARMLAH